MSYIIPEWILLSRQINPTEKLLYALIRHDCQRFGHCVASNQFFSDMLDLTHRNIQRCLAHLKEVGLITTDCQNEQRFILLETEL